MLELAQGAADHGKNISWNQRFVWVPNLIPMPDWRAYDVIASFLHDPDRCLHAGL